MLRQIVGDGESVSLNKRIKFSLLLLVLLASVVRVGNAQERKGGEGEAGDGGPLPENCTLHIDEWKTALLDPEAEGEEVALIEYDTEEFGEGEVWLAPAAAGVGLNDAQRRRMLALALQKCKLRQGQVKRVRVNGIARAIEATVDCCVACKLACPLIVARFLKLT